MNFQVGQLPEYRNFRVQLGRCPQNLRQQQPRLAVDLHLLAVIARQVQVLLHRIVQGARFGQLLFPLLPLRQRPNLRALAIHAGDVELGYVLRRPSTA